MFRVGSGVGGGVGGGGGIILVLISLLNAQ